jgi:hypothetical protein
VPTGAAIFSRHFLQWTVKSHTRLSGKLNTYLTVGEQKANTQGGLAVDYCFQEA